MFVLPVEQLHGPMAFASRVRDGGTAFFDQQFVFMADTSVNGAVQR